MPAERPAFVVCYEEIRCPDCETVQRASVTYSPGDPFVSFVHWCSACGYVILESEWERVGYAEMSPAALMSGAFLNFPAGMLVTLAHGRYVPLRYAAWERAVRWAGRVFGAPRLAAFREREIVGVIFAGMLLCERL